MIRRSIGRNAALTVTLTVAAITLVGCSSTNPSDSADVDPGAASSSESTEQTAPSESGASSQDGADTESVDGACSALNDVGSELNASIQDAFTGEGDAANFTELLSSSAAELNETLDSLGNQEVRDAAQPLADALQGMPDFEGALSDDGLGAEGAEEVAGQLESLTTEIIEARDSLADLCGSTTW